jgi:hypothetical protein
MQKFLGENVIASGPFQVYRAPTCYPCTTAGRGRWQTDMKIQVNDFGLARWECQVCSEKLTWNKFKQMPGAIAPVGWVSTGVSVHSDSESANSHSEEDVPIAPHVPPVEDPVSPDLAAFRAAEVKAKRWFFPAKREPEPAIELGKWVDGGRYWLPCPQKAGGHPFTPSRRPPSPDCFRVIKMPNKYRKAHPLKGKGGEAASSSASGNSGLRTAAQLVAEKEQIRVRAAAIDAYLEEQGDALDQEYLARLDRETLGEAEEHEPEHSDGCPYSSSGNETGASGHTQSDKDEDEPTPGIVVSASSVCLPARVRPGRATVPTAFLPAILNRNTLALLTPPEADEDTGPWPEGYTRRPTHGRWRDLGYCPSDPHTPSSFTTVGSADNVD